MAEIRAEDAVKNLILAAAPERKKEFMELWEHFSPQIEYTEDKVGFSLEAGAYRLVLFNHKSMAQIWLLGFAAQYALHAYFPYLILSNLQRQPIKSENFLHYSSTIKLSNLAKSLLNETIILNTSHSIDSFIWPPEVPEPFNGKPTDQDGAMVFDLLCMAAAYCFLHEIKHVMFKEAGETLEIHDEEFACDTFARQFLLEEIELFSKSSNYPLEPLRMKRAMSICLSSLLLLVLTPKNQWNGSQSHPSIIERIKALTNSLALPDDNFFWAYLSCIIILILENSNIKFSYQFIESQKEFCLYLLNQIQSQHHSDLKIAKF